MVYSVSGLVWKPLNQPVQGLYPYPPNGHVPWQPTGMTAHAHSPAGRTAVPKTAGRRIEANRVRHGSRTVKDQPAITVTATAWPKQTNHAGPPRTRIPPKPPNTQDGNMSNKAGSGRYQNGAARRKCKARHIAAEGPIPICPLCGKPIDLTLKTPHPLSCELDEIIPYSRGGSPTSYDNTQLTHRICNQRKSNKITANTTGHQNTKKQPQNTIPISRQW